MSKLVSIIVPCYNQAIYLDECLESALNQTYREWECIIVNDGSTDATEQIALKYCEFDSRFIYKKKINGGLSSARNLGLKFSQGKFLQFLDCDDILMPEKLEIQINNIPLNLKSDNLFLSICDYYIGRDSNILNLSNHENRTFFKSNDYLKELILDWESSLSIPCHSFLFSAQIFKDNGIRFDETLLNHEDFECWIRIFSLKLHVIQIKDKLVVYRLNPKSLTSYHRLMGEGFLQALDKHLNKKNIYSSVLKSKRRNVLVSYRRFDKMNSVDFLLKFNSVSRYYMKRAIHKMFIK
jgi:glycosyltransferase involved in cell wall biosynthesis